MARINQGPPLDRLWSAKNCACTAIHRLATAVGNTGRIVGLNDVERLRDGIREARRALDSASVLLDQHAPPGPTERVTSTAPVPTAGACPPSPSPSPSSSPETSESGSPPSNGSDS